MIEKEQAEKPRLGKARKISLQTGNIGGRTVMRAEQLSKSFDSKIVFRNIDLSVDNGAKIGIIGRNGSGKSTLLNIIVGAIADYDGSVQWTPQAMVGYFSQEHENLDQRQTVLYELIQEQKEEQTRARAILARLNILHKKVFQSISSLSLGERSKVALAKILFSRPNVLVLDEPTNHLELSAREALEGALDDYEGTVIIASHDRYLLDRVTSEIFDIENNRHYPGTYSEYIARFHRDTE
jgi:ATP-binding cassette subfamily F protein 3